MGQCVCAHMLSKRPRSASTAAGCNGNLSATFHILDSGCHWELLNINNATEEELMTLPGISRSTAHNIVEHRLALGGFRKVEDLALVSGVGAAKLELFINEICVNNKKSSGHVSSGSPSTPLRSHSFETFSNNTEITSTPALAATLPSSMSHRTIKYSPSKLVNINTANVFKLMTIRGMTQEMAANIVHHREKKGPFRTIDDVRKVKGISLQKFSNIKSYLTLEYPPEPPSSNGENNCAKSCVNGAFNSSTTLNNLPQWRTSKRPQLQANSICDPNLQLYHLVAPFSSRPLDAPKFAGLRGGKPAVRLAYWDLDRFTADKCQNHGAQEVICRTLLEMGINLIALHSIEKEAAEMLVSELNDPQLPSVQSWQSKHSLSGKWVSAFPCLEEKEKKHLVAGFIFTESFKISNLLKLDHDGETSAILGFFMAESLTFAFVIILSSSPISFHLINSKLRGEQNIIIASAQSSPFKDDALPPKEFGFKNLASTGSLWVSEQLALHLTGEKGLVEDGLWHLAIPDGWRWGGRVSPYNPLWLELFAQPLQHGLANGSCPHHASALPLNH